MNDGLASYVMIGGFLGAGKTTAIAALARRLAAAGQRCGLITNDQSVGLADTALLRAEGFRVEEITGGCFCCRFDSLAQAAERLRAGERPGVLVAEPVGSCTDLTATVALPLRALYGDRYRVAPLSVVVDPARALRVLGIESGASFSSKVLYVYEKQLEEAEVITVNKCDAVAAERLDRLEDRLAERFPAARRFRVSARSGAGLDAWFDHVLGRDALVLAPPDVDYDLYAEGEALLGWYNAGVRLVAGAPYDGNRLLLELAGSLRSGFAERGIEVAHLKMVLEPEGVGGGLAAVHFTGGGVEPELSRRFDDLVESGTLTVNLRAEGDPEALRDATVRRLDDLLRARGIRREIRHEERFRPARPVPTHRMGSRE